VTDTHELPRVPVLRRGQYIAFQGPLGAGKTLAMTALGAYCYAGGHTLYAHYDCVYARPIMSVSHLFRIRNAVLMLDELQSIVDSREFKKNVDMSQWAVIVRKLGLTILYTTQFLGQVDLRIRHVTSFVYMSEAVFQGSQESSRYTIVRWHGEGGRVVRRFILPHTDALYALYDSYDYRVKLTLDGRESSFSGGV